MKLPPDALWEFVTAGKPKRTAWFKSTGKSRHAVFASSEPD